MSESITFEQDGETCVLWVSACKGLDQVRERLATPADLAAAGYMRVPDVEELATAIYEAQSVRHAWEDANTTTRDYFLSQARAVLRALGVTTDGEGA